jgi:hypothetical protein
MQRLELLPVGIGELVGGLNTELVADELRTETPIQQVLK